MRINWRGLELPTRVVRDESVSTATYGLFAIEPFERGFGTTVGNSLRRILLSSLEGAAVTNVRLTGADHEFASLPGVMEDVCDIVLNVKSLVIRSESDQPRLMSVSRSTAGQVTAGDIEADPAIEIVNKDLVLATLTEDVDFRLEMTVERGRGYLPAEEHAGDREPVIGEIAVDAVFSPVARVRYRTEDTRVGQRVNYDRLVMEIWTKGTISPEMALVEAAKILRKHLNPLIQYFELGTQRAVKDAGEPAAPAVIDEALRAKLDTKIADLDLSVRAANCLESINIDTIGDLIQCPEPELLKVRNFGKTSLREVKRKLAEMQLSLGMDLGSVAGPEDEDAEEASDDESETADEAAED